MQISRGAARLTQTHVHSLSEASDAIAAAARQIQRNNPQWGEATLALLILANDKVVNVMNVGAASIARYIEQHGIKEPGSPTDDQPPVERPEPDPNSQSGDL